MTNGLPAVVDNVAPTVSNIVTAVSTSSANVSWNTNEQATSRVYYSTSSAITSTSSTNFIENLTLKVSHLLSIAGLLPDTVYYFIIRSVDGSGNATTTPSFTATTTAL